MKAFLRQASIFNELGNSSATASAAWDCFSLAGNAQNDTILKLDGECMAEKRLQKRHPDPEDVSKITYSDAALQVRSVWNKLQMGKGNGHPASRRAFASVVWEGMERKVRKFIRTYYVFGGLHGTKKPHSDGWALNLRDLKQGWRKVPHPKVELARDTDTHRLALQGDKAYFFVGQPDVHVFNLQTVTWSTMRTTMRRGTSWARVFPGNRFEAYACAVYGNTIYYFGGVDGSNRLGRNAVVALALTTLQWEVASGKVEANNDPTLPGIREYPVMWADQGKLWVAFGNANRQAEWYHRTGEQTLNKEAPINRTYRDLWSYDLKKKQWLDESRDTAAQTFNDLWELSIEVPGSKFKESDFEVDDRFSKLGPWKRCFTCGSVGRWLTCAGACRNTDQAAAFCGVECQKKGWKDHKEVNKCRKV
ncbi:hypothetical protein FRC00_009686 [Tulasnella sp. 408]|nr:hypothetical protein FRC00_009686 [Tulasnella sp. 408]